MKKKWKVLLVCVVVLTGIAAWCLVPRPAVEEDFKIHYVRTGERLTDITGQVDLEASAACCGTQTAWDTTGDMTAGSRSGMC